MFAKFEAFMNRVFMPLAHKVDNQRHLGAIKAGMVAMTPFTILGSIFATLGVVTTSFILVTIISKILNKFKESEVIKGALLGMRPVLIALIIYAFIDLAKEVYIDLKSIIITLIIGVILLSKKVHPILVIVIAAVLGLIFYL